MAEAGFHDVEVAAVAGFIAGGENVEQLLDLIDVHDFGDCLAAGVEVALLDQGDQLFNDGTVVLRLGQGCYNLHMLDEGLRQIYTTTSRRTS